VNFEGNLMPLSEERRAQLKARGAIETTIQEFLGTNDAEMAVIDGRINREASMTLPESSRQDDSDLICDARAKTES
jgi:hypothetical protein